MPLMLYNGVILVRSGSIATSVSCCCGADCCLCEVYVPSLGISQNLREVFTLGLSMKIRISGAITGYCTMITGPPTTEPPEDTPCAIWSLDQFVACDEDIVESCGLNLTSVVVPTFYCPEATAPEDWTMEATLSNLGCNFVTNALPTRYGDVAQKPTVITCDPNETFYAKFIFPLYDSAPGGCGSCADTQIIFEIDGPY